MSAKVRHETILRVCLPVRWFNFCMLLETCCTSFSREKYVGFAVARGGVCGAGGGGGAMDFLQILFVEQMV